MQLSIKIQECGISSEKKFFNSKIKWQKLTSYKIQQNNDCVKVKGLLNKCFIKDAEFGNKK